VINPTSKQILLVTTPRDYYVQLPVVGNAYDKLTHAGIYGINASIETLEQLYGIDISYYVRMNFTGFMNIVDALGGVDVYSSKNFTGEVYGYHFDEGYNHVDGRQALSFVRERHSFADGDFQRQRNQMEMIKAIVKKIASPSILTTYTALLSSLADSFATDMPADKIGELVKMQLADGGDWNIQSYGVSGKGARRSTFSMGSRSLYVALQDPDSVAHAKELIDRVFAGDKLTDADSQVGNQE
jgi:LCP family protein required for cell wall assembly